MTRSKTCCGRGCPRCHRRAMRGGRRDRSGFPLRFLAPRRPALGVPAPAARGEGVRPSPAGDPEPHPLWVPARRTTLKAHGRSCATRAPPRRGTLLHCFENLDWNVLETSGAPDGWRPAAMVCVTYGVRRAFVISAHVPEERRRPRGRRPDRAGGPSAHRDGCALHDARAPARHRLRARARHLHGRRARMCPSWCAVGRAGARPAMMRLRGRALCASVVSARTARSRWLDPLEADGRGYDGKSSVRTRRSCVLPDAFATQTAPGFSPLLCTLPPRFTMNASSPMLGQPGNRRRLSFFRDARAPRSSLNALPAR